MRPTSVRPLLTFKGRTFHRLLGWASTPTQPLLTDLPVAADGEGTYP